MTTHRGACSGFTQPSPCPHARTSVCVQGEEVKALFGVDGGTGDPDFFYMLADSAAMADQVRHWPSQSFDLIRHAHDTLACPRRPD